MLLTVGLTLALVIASVFFHKEVLRATSVAMPSVAVLPRCRLLVVIGVTFVAHIIEICLFSVGFWLMEFTWGSAGLVLIGWSASFIHLAMVEFWDMHKPHL